MIVCIVIGLFVIYGTYLAAMSNHPLPGMDEIEGE